jgi:hypothetical protein
MIIKALVCSGEGGSSSDPATSLPVIVSKYSYANNLTSYPVLITSIKKTYSD